MITLLLSLLLLRAAPDMYRDEVARDEFSVTVSLIPPAPRQYTTVPAMTGRMPRTLYLLSLPVWRPVDQQKTCATAVLMNQPPVTTSPLIRQRYQPCFDDLQAGKHHANLIETRRETDPLSCRISAATLSRRAFMTWPSDVTVNADADDDLSCAQVMALASFFPAGVVSTDRFATNPAPDNDTASSFFSVLNLTIPTNSAPAPNWQSLSNRHAVSEVDTLPAGAFIFPLTHEIVVTSPYGMRYHPVTRQFMRHEGVDLRAPVNSPVMSVADGEVTATGYGPVTGFYITVSHADGWSSRYLHLNTLQVHKGDKVFRGNVIALSGATGRINGPHLHLELSHHHQLVNPMEVLFASTLNPNARRASHVADTPAVIEPVDMTPTIALISGEGENLQIGVRVGKKTTFYAQREPVETPDGVWRIVKRYGKYRLVKVSSEAKPE